MINMKPACDEYVKLTQAGKLVRARKLQVKIECAYNWFKAYGMTQQALECERALIFIRRFKDVQTIRRDVSECVQRTENGSSAASEVDLHQV